jgi:hypothetical protein
LSAPEKERDRESVCERERERESERARQGERERGHTEADLRAPAASRALRFRSATCSGFISQIVLINYF